MELLVIDVMQVDEVTTEKNTSWLDFIVLEDQDDIAAS